MMYYNIILIIIFSLFFLFSIFLDSLSNQINKKKLDWCSSIILIILLQIFLLNRIYFAATDDDGYIDYIENVLPALNDPYNGLSATYIHFGIYNILYHYLNSLVITIFSRDIFYIYILSAIFFTIKAIVIIKLCNNKLNAILFYFSYLYFIHDITQLRVSFGLVFIYLLIYGIVSNISIYIQLLLILISGSFHTSLFSSLPFLFAKYIKKKYIIFSLKFLIIIAIVIIVLNLSINYQIILSGLNILFSNTHYSHYLNINNLVNPSSNYAIITLITFIYLYFFEFRKSSNIKIMILEKISYFSLCLGVLFFVIFIQYDVIGGRLLDIFYIGLVFMLGNINMSMRQVIMSKLLILLYFFRSTIYAPLISF